MEEEAWGERRGYRYNRNYLQSIGQEFVQFVDLSRYAKINCTITDFHDQSTENFWIDLLLQKIRFGSDIREHAYIWWKDRKAYLVDDLKLLPLLDELWFRDGTF